MSFNQNFTATGLSTLTASVPQAGPTFVKGKLSLPTLVGGGGASSCVVTVSQTPLSGSPTVVYTGSAGAEGFFVNILCAAQDTVTVALSSSAAPDQPLNVIKAQIQIGSGQ